MINEVDLEVMGNKMDERAQVEEEDVSLPSPNGKLKVVPLAKKIVATSGTGNLDSIGSIRKVQYAMRRKILDSAKKSKIDALFK